MQLLLTTYLDCFVCKLCGILLCLSLLRRWRRRQLDSTSQFRFSGSVRQSNRLERTWISKIQNKLMFSISCSLFIYFVDHCLLCEAKKMSAFLQLISIVSNYLQQLSPPWYLWEEARVKVHVQRKHVQFKLRSIRNQVENAFLMNHEA